MRITAIGLLLAAQWLYGQQTAAQSVNIPLGGFKSQALYFANTDSRQGMQEINNAIMSITSIPAALDLTQRTLEVRGSADKIELAEWLFNELDRPATAQASQGPNSTTYTEQLPDGRTLTEVVRVFYFTNSTSPRHIQETANTIRAIADISRPMPIFNERRAIVLRGRVDRMGLAEWLFNELNQLPTARRAGVLQYRLPTATADPDHSDLTRIFYLSGTANAQQVFNAIRSSIKMPDSRHPDFPRMMPDTEQNVLVIRASDSQMADAEKLVQQLDSPSTKQ